MRDSAPSARCHLVFGDLVDEMPFRDVEFWANVATILVIAVAVVTFVVERSRIERQREEAAFEIVTTHYMRFLELALENPDLTLSQLDTDLLATSPKKVWETPRDEVRDAVLFEYFFQVIEKVFVLYRATDLLTHMGRWDERKMREKLANRDWRKRKLAESKDFRTRQWLGWDEWLRDYAKSPAIREWWGVLDNPDTYDTRFVEYMQFRLEAVQEDESQDGKPQ